MIDIQNLTDKDFAQLPLVIEGESKEVRYLEQGLVVIRFKPTIYSFTHNRCGIVPGSDTLRLKATRKFLEVLSKAGIKHAYQQVTDKWVLSKLVVPHPVEYKKYQNDNIIQPWLLQSLVGAHVWETLPKGTPVEIIIKSFHGGTSKHRYHLMNEQKVRSSHPLFNGCFICNEQPYPHHFVRFDWRNPLQIGDKKVQDEILPEPLADCFIDIKAAKKTALKVHETLEEFLGARDIVCNDLCLFIAEDGETLYGEVSQDCGRFRHFDLGSLDKDVWRGGGSSDIVLEKWQKLLDCIEI